MTLFLIFEASGIGGLSVWLLLVERLLVLFVFTVCIRQVVECEEYDTHLLLPSPSQGTEIWFSLR